VNGGRKVAELVGTGLILRAMAFAATKHDGQYRKSATDAKIPYITHPLRVAGEMVRHGVIDEDYIAAAICHDVLEDTPTTYEELAEAIGARAATIVAEVTDDKSLPKDARKEAQVARAPYYSDGAKLIKAADKADNLLSIVVTPPKWSAETKLGYAASAERVVSALGLGERHPLVVAFYGRVSEVRAAVIS
jgi:GTP diphosphokinase / guanosine-3',5'-bis(diphosphate) 3'-diphosphatase